MIIKYITFLIGIIWSYSIIKTQSVFSKKAGIIFKIFITKISWFSLIAACYFGYKNFSIKSTVIGVIIGVLLVNISFFLLKKYINKYPDIEFVGLKTGEELAKYYADADVFVFPSKTDTLGNVILESLASGTPIAAYPVTGPKDILANSNINSLDENLDVSIKKALEIKRDDCRKFALKLTWEDCTNQYLSFMIDAKTGEPVVY